MGASIGVVAVVLFISFFLFLALGLQVSLGIGLSSFIALLFSLPFDMTIIASAQKMITGLDNFALLAIPFFILSGNIMNNGGIAIKLVNFAKLIDVLRRWGDNRSICSVRAGSVRNRSFCILAVALIAYGLYYGHKHNLPAFLF